MLDHAKGMLGGYCYLLPNCLLQRPYLIEAGVLAALCLAVEESLAVQVDLQPSIIYGGDGYGDLVLKLCEELSRYPSGLW